MIGLTSAICWHGTFVVAGLGLALLGLRDYDTTTTQGAGEAATPLWVLGMLILAVETVYWGLQACGLCLGGLS